MQVSRKAIRSMQLKLQDNLDRRHKERKIARNRKAERSAKLMAVVGWSTVSPEVK